MQKDIDVVKEEYFHSKDNKDGAYNMARITIELPITAWRAMKGKIYNDELISHQRRSSDLVKEDGIKCVNCGNNDVILRESLKIDPVKYKEVFYKCKRCGHEFQTDFLIKENKRRMANKKI